MRRTKLSLGERQGMNLLLALSYAIDTFVDDDEPDKVRAGNERQVREWERLRDTIHTARAKARARS